jgi:hypothetical protein
VHVFPNFYIRYKNSSTYFYWALNMRALGNVFSSMQEISLVVTYIQKTSCAIGKT